MTRTAATSRSTGELTRAKALDHDMLKTYVRLPADRMKKVIDSAHAMGLTSPSH